MYLLIPVIYLFIMGIKIVKPSERGLIEKHKRYFKFVKPGFHWINPIIDRLFTVNISEQMVDTLQQCIITDDNLKVNVDAQIYFRVKADEENVIKVIYNFGNYKMSIINFARVSLKNLIGPITRENAHSENKKINIDLCNELQNIIMGRGIEIIRTELIEADKIISN